MQESCPCLQLLFGMYALLTFYYTVLFAFLLCGVEGSRSCSFPDMLAAWKLTFVVLRNFFYLLVESIAESASPADELCAQPALLKLACLF